MHPDPRPGQIPPKLGVRSYPVVERYNLIFIWTGDPEKADPNLILDYPPLEDPEMARACPATCTTRPTGF